MSKLDSLPGRALELATQVGEGLRDKMPERAMQWIETGAAIGALKTGSRVAGRLVRRNPAVAVAAVAGAGLLWYLARRKQKQSNGEAIEGKATRIEAKRAGAARTGTKRATKRRQGAAQTETT